MYQHIEYPKFLYHATEPARVVATAEEHAALPAGWHASPALAEPTVLVVMPPVEYPFEIEIEPEPEVAALKAPVTKSKSVGRR